MLPLGAVSDEFNGDISVVEQRFIREGIVSMARPLLGPGKRGSLSVSKATKSTVHLIGEVEDGDSLALGYSSRGISVEIPHLRIDIETGQVQFSMSQTDNHQSVMTDFLDALRTAESIKIKTTLETQVPVNTVLIGIQDKVEENFNCFILKNPDSTSEITKEKLKDIGNKIRFDSTTPENKTYLPRVYHHFNYRPDDLRVYSKIAFNVLAYIKGSEFVSQSKFDAVRKWIADGGDYEQIKLAPDMQHPLKPMNIMVPVDSHTIYLAASENVLCADVFLYGGMAVSMILTDRFSGQSFTDGFICDWKNRREFRLMEYIQWAIANRSKADRPST